MTRTLRLSDSRAERVQSLVLEKIDTLSRCPAELRDETTHKALLRLRPHMEAVLEELETLEWLRDLTDEELARREAFVLLMAVTGQLDVERKSTRQSILEALQLDAATIAQLQKRTGAAAGTIRNNLSVLINEGQVVSEGGRPKIYRLASSGSKNTL
jgi:predicted Rossmann fold nucleotide-binding protein DprA/Smf involved in DNA uptake